MIRKNDLFLHGVAMTQLLSMKSSDELVVGSCVKLSHEDVSATINSRLKTLFRLCFSADSEGAVNMLSASWYVVNHPVAPNLVC